MYSLILIEGASSNRPEITDEEFARLPANIKGLYRKKVEVEQHSDGVALSAPEDPDKGYTREELGDVLSALAGMLTRNDSSSNDSPSDDCSSGSDCSGSDSSFDFGGGDGGGAGSGGDY